jgi:chromosome segregation ATPase
MIDREQAMAKLQDLVAAAQRERDELRVQLHLGKAEAKEEWEKLEARLEELRGRLDAARGPAGEVLEDVGEKAKALGDEIVAGVSRLRALLK